MHVPCKFYINRFILRCSIVLEYKEKNLGFNVNNANVFQKLFQRLKRNKGKIQDILTSTKGASLWADANQPEEEKLSSDTDLFYCKALLGGRKESRTLGCLDNCDNGSWIQF